MTHKFNHNDEIYLDTNNKTKDLHIGNEIASGDKGVVYEISNDPTKVVKLMIIGDNPDNEIFSLKFRLKY